MFLLQYSQLSQEFADDDENLDRFGFALCQTFSKFEDQVDFCKKSRFLPGYKKYVHVTLLAQMEIIPFRLGGVCFMDDLKLMSRQKLDA